MLIILTQHGLNNGQFSVISAALSVYLLSVSLLSQVSALSVSLLSQCLCSLGVSALSVSLLSQCLCSLSVSDLSVSPLVADLRLLSVSLVSVGSCIVLLCCAAHRVVILQLFIGLHQGWGRNAYEYNHDTRTSLLLY